MKPAFWIYEDDLPDSLTDEQYARWFPFSKVDIVRIFPVYLPEADTLESNE